MPKWILVKEDKWYKLYESNTNQLVAFHLSPVEMLMHITDQLLPNEWTCNIGYRDKYIFYREWDLRTYVRNIEILWDNQYV